MWFSIEQQGRNCKGPDSAPRCLSVTRQRLPGWCVFSKWLVEAAGIEPATDSSALELCRELLFDPLAHQRVRVALVVGLDVGGTVLLEPPGHFARGEVEVLLQLVFQALLRPVWVGAAQEDSDVLPVCGPFLLC